MIPEHEVAGPEARKVMDRLRAEDQAQRDKGLPVEERTRNVTAPTGLFLFSIVRTKQPQLVVEVGSSTAYSTIWMALAASTYGGRVVGTEIISERAAIANQNLIEAGLSSVAEIRPGDGGIIAQEFSGIDLLFLDAEKDDYSIHFERVFSSVRPGGLILTDNVVSHDCTPFLEMVRARTDCVTQTLNFDRGIEFTVKL